MTKLKLLGAAVLAASTLAVPQAANAQWGGRGWHGWHGRHYYAGGPRWHGVRGPHYGWYNYRGRYYRECGYRIGYRGRRIWTCR